MKKMVFVLALFCSIALHAANSIITPPAKAALCIACHGPMGNSTNPQWPNIAGQHSSYIYKQLLDYKKRTARSSATMNAIVATLSDEEMRELANFYAAQPIAEGQTPEKYLKRGEQLYRGGDFDKHITACIACHGPRGTGNAQAGFPSLSGQNAPYLITQLQEFKDKKRQNDLNGIMRDICTRMDLEDMENVAYYIQGLY
jgi:cytochrome c553